MRLVTPEHTFIIIFSRSTFCFYKYSGLFFHDTKPRYIRPCCARVPQTDSEIFVSPSDRLKPKYGRTK